MNQNNIQNLNRLSIFIVLLVTTACESMSAGGNVWVGVVAGIVVAILLGWGAFKLLGGMLKVGIWGTVILVLIVIGVIVWLIFKVMGS